MLCQCVADVLATYNVYKADVMPSVADGIAIINIRHIFGMKICTYKVYAKKFTFKSFSNIAVFSDYS